MAQGLINLTSQELSHWLIEASQEANKGRLPNYIPLLQQTDPNLLAVCILPIAQQANVQGNRDKNFPLMSVIKPFLFFYLLCYLGKEVVFNKVGCQPSNYPFNSLEQLQIDQGFPRNPMINSGAITLASLLPGKDGQTRCQNLQLWLNQQANCHLFLDKLMLNSVQSLPNRSNQAILQELVKQNRIKEPEITLDAYNHICCLSGNIIDLARLGLLLVNCPSSLSQENCLIVREIMTTCGLYEASENLAQTLGFPSKSGVSGVILSLVPEQGAIACYSPPLDGQGNSIAGLFMIQKIAQFLEN